MGLRRRSYPKPPGYASADGPASSARTPHGVGPSTSIFADARGNRFMELMSPGCPTSGTDKSALCDVRLAVGAPHGTSWSFLIRGRSTLTRQSSKPEKQSHHQHPKPTLLNVAPDAEDHPSPSSCGIGSTESTGDSRPDRQPQRAHIHSFLKYCAVGNSRNPADS